MEKQKPKRPQAPLYLDCHDIQLIEGGELHTARRRLTQIKKSRGLGKKDRLSIWAYCDANKLLIEQVLPFYRFLLIAASISIAFAFGKILLEYSCEFFRQHKMIWEEHTENYLKGHTFVTDSLTGKTTKQTIEIRKTEPQITVFGNDTLKTDTFINITAE